MKKTKKKTVFVTGATGFIGSHLVKRLVAEGWNVTGLARRPIRTVKNKDLARINWVYGDIRDKHWHKNARENTVIIHLAGIHGYRQVNMNERYSVELGGTKNLVSAVQKTVKLFIHVSTAYVNMDTDYAKAKHAAKQFVEQEINKGFPAVIVCPVAVYGSTRDHNMGRLFHGVKHGRFAYIGAGTIPLHLIFIDDLVEGMMKVMSNSKLVIGRSIILGDKKPVRLVDLVNEIADAYHVNRPFIHLPVLPMKIAGRIFSFINRFGIPVPFTTDTVTTLTTPHEFDVSVAKKLLGFEAKTTIEQGIQKTIAS